MTEDCKYTDSLWLVERSPFRKLIFPRTAEVYLNHIYDIVSEYSYLFDFYPEEKYEQVDEIYYIHQNLCVFDLELAADFFKLSYRGACWASFLIAISPDKKYLKLLSDFLNTCHENNHWIAGLAIDAIEGVMNSHQEKLTHIRLKIKSLKRQEIRLRLAPSIDEQQEINDEVMLIKNIYKVSGAGEAIQFLKSTKLHKHIVCTKEWLGTSHANT